VTYDFTALETNLAVLEMYYGVKGKPGITLTDLYEDQYTDMYGQYTEPQAPARAAMFAVDDDAYFTDYTSRYAPDRDPANEHVIKGGPLFLTALVIDIVDGPGVIRRYAPQVAVTPNGDVTFSPSQAIDYPLSCTCLPDPGIDGSVTVYYNRLLNR